MKSTRLMYSPPDHLRNALDMLIKWTNAIAIQAERVQRYEETHPPPFPDQTGEPVYGQQIDGEFYLIALRNLAVSLNYAEKHSATFPATLRDAIREAKVAFDGQLPDTKAARDALLHFDDYASHAGGPPGAKDKTALSSTQGLWDDDSARPKCSVSGVYRRS